MTFVCQCKGNRFVRVERFQTDGRTLPLAHGTTGGHKPMIQCVQCQTVFEFDVETHLWEEMAK